MTLRRFALALLLPLAACADESAPVEGIDGADTLADGLEAAIEDATVDDGILVSAEVGGLSEGLHGFHIHETGDCSAPDALSAGGHYNPADAPHGAPEAPGAERHVGDLGNLEAGADGRARYERVDSVLTLSGPTSIVGKAVIVHAGQDDFTTQPTGDAGPRLACGVIERAEG